MWTGRREDSRAVHRGALGCTPLPNPPRPNTQRKQAGYTPGLRVRGGSPGLQWPSEEPHLTGPGCLSRLGRDTLTVLCVSASGGKTAPLFLCSLCPGVHMVRWPLWSHANGSSLGEIALGLPGTCMAHLKGACVRKGWLLNKPNTESWQGQ